MRIISFDKEALRITIHNLYPSLELTSPIYFGTDTTCHVSSSQQTGNGTVIEACFGIDSKQEDISGALLYKLQRKHTTRIDNRLNSGTTFIEDTTTDMYFLVVWNVRDYDHKFYACLIECTNDFAWDEAKLWALYEKYNSQFYANYKSSINTWLMHGDTVMTSKLDVTYGSDYKLNTVISEGTGRHNMKTPMKIDPKMLVLPLSTLC
jgi:hypothetical protein